MTRPDVYRYLDYRVFLADMFAYCKATIPAFSHRYFASKAKFAAPNFLKLVLDGERNLTNESIAKVAKGFQLKKSERVFLETLVYMNQATTHEERDHYYKKMIGADGFSKIRPLDKAKYEYYSKWYYPVIRELAVIVHGPCHPAEIAALLVPPISIKQAEKALELLVELNLLKKVREDCYQQTEAVVSTGPEVHSLVVANYHRTMLRLASDALDAFTPDTRDITSVTLAVNHERMSELKKMITAFRQELLVLACEDKDADTVVQINLQAFPLSRNIRENQK